VGHHASRQGVGSICAVAAGTRQPPQPRAATTGREEAGQSSTLPQVQRGEQRWGSPSFDVVSAPRCKVRLSRPTWCATRCRSHAVGISARHWRMPRCCTALDASIGPRAAGLFESNTGPCLSQASSEPKRPPQACGTAPTMVAVQRRVLGLPARVPRCRGCSQQLGGVGNKRARVSTRMGRRLRSSPRLQRADHEGPAQGCL